MLHPMCLNMNLTGCQLLQSQYEFLLSQLVKYWRFGIVGQNLTSWKWDSWIIFSYTRGKKSDILIKLLLSMWNSARIKSWNLNLSFVQMSIKFVACDTYAWTYLWFAGTLTVTSFYYKQKPLQFQKMGAVWIHQFELKRQELLERLVQTIGRTEADAGLFIAAVKCLSWSSRVRWLPQTIRPLIKSIKVKYLWMYHRLSSYVCRLKPDTEFFSRW